MSSVEEDLLKFREDLQTAVKIFLKLHNKYEHDDADVLELIPIFREFLKEFNKKYPAIEIVLDEEDFTEDDLKVLLNDFTSKDQIKKRFNVSNIPLTIRQCKSHNKLQVILDMDDIEEEVYDEVDALGALAIQNMNKADILIPQRLQFLSLDIGEEYGTTDQAMPNKGI